MRAKHNTASVAPKSKSSKEPSEQKREATIADWLKRPDSPRIAHNSVGNVVYRHLIGVAVKDPDELTSRSAEAYAADVVKRMAPRDAMEELLILQALWTHARMAKLSIVAIEQTSTKNVQVCNEACDRAANTYRRQMLALAEYRRPPRQDSFAIIKQANLANQQVVNNVESPNSQKQNPSNEQGLPPPAQLPAYEIGTGIPASVNYEEQTMAAEHRTQDDHRQEPFPAERNKAR